MDTKNIYVLNNRIDQLNQDVRDHIKETIDLYGPIMLETERDELFLTISLANYKITEIYLYNGECLAKGINQHNGIAESGLELIADNYQCILSFMAKIMLPENYGKSDTVITPKYGTVCCFCGSKNVVHEVDYNPNTQEVISHSFSDESDVCMDCMGTGCLSNIDYLSFEIERAYYDYMIVHNNEPLFFIGKVIYPEDNYPFCGFIIKLNLDVMDDEVDKVRHYCNGIDGLKDLLKFDRSRFMIVSIKCFTNSI